MAKIPVQYRLMSLEFRNGLPENQNRLGFRSALLLHDDRQKAVVIDGIDTPGPERDRLLSLFMPFELSTIRYEIRTPELPPVPFCHPFPARAGVHLSRLGNSDKLFLSRKGGKPFFSDNFTLRDVTAGRINSGQSAYQFHE